MKCIDCIFDIHNLDQFESWFHTHFQEPKPRPRFVVKAWESYIAVLDTHHHGYEDFDNYNNKRPWYVASWDNSPKNFLPTWMFNKAHELAKTLNDKE